MKKHENTKYISVFHVGNFPRTVSGENQLVHSGPTTSMHQSGNGSPLCIVGPAHAGEGVDRAGVTRRSPWIDCAQVNSYWLIVFQISVIYTQLR